MPNRLSSSTSPYLQQHAGNPVDWWEWSDEAFAEARRRDVPVLLSVGYAACHWCHVMAAESFDDPDTAAQMNAGFVNVKVDREERPDVDSVYMQATMAMTGQGGWPMTVFLTTDGRPFQAGTYYPPQPRHGMPSFRQLLRAVGDAWRDRRDEVESVAHRLATTLAGGEHASDPGGEPRGEVRGEARGDGRGDSRGPALTPPAPRVLPTLDALAAAVSSLAGEEDPDNGGFGAAPKFPPSMVLEFLLRHAAGDAPTAAIGRDMAGRTLLAMARSGMYDQVAGGFARYSVDAAWVVPHFEKMLSDNAQLARVYLHWWRLTGEATGRRVAEETCDWMVGQLRTPEGGLASSLDADTPVEGRALSPDLDALARRLPSGGHGVEGLTYAWTPDQLRDALGDEDGSWAAELLGVTSRGTFHAGASTLRLARDPWPNPGEAERWTEIRRRLADARARRPQPERDDKVVAAWNGLAVAALAECGALLERPDLVAAAQDAARVLVELHVDGESGRLRRVSRDGRAGRPAGVLEDYGDVAEGLLTLAGVDGDPAWVRVALRLLDTVVDEFADPEVPGVLYDVSAAALDDALAAVRRPRDQADNAYPSGGSAAAGALLRAAALTGRARYRETAEAALAAVEPLLTHAPRFTGWWWAVAQAAVDGPLEIAVVGPPGPQRDVLHRTALAATAPGAVVAVGEPGARVPELLADRGDAAGRPAAHVCRGFVCRLPLTEQAALAAEVGAVFAARELT